MTKDGHSQFLAAIKAEALARGYTFEVRETATEREERVIRPDGSVAVIARKQKDASGSGS